MKSVMVINLLKNQDLIEISICLKALHCNKLSNNILIIYWIV